MNHAGIARDRRAPFCRIAAGELTLRPLFRISTSPGRVFPVLGLLLVLFPCGGILAQPDRAPLSARLERALSDPAALGLKSSEPLVVWVFFEGRGLGPAALEAALQEAEAGLDERTARRRAKVLPPGSRLVDDGDLPVNPEFLALVADRGGVLRRQSRWLNAASFAVPAGRIEAVRSLECVRRLDLVARHRRDPLPEPRPAEAKSRLGASGALWTNDYGLNLDAIEQINVPPVHEMGVTGRGVVVGMLDTGFRTTHESLDQIPILAAYDFVNDDPVVDNEGDDPTSSINHGTMTLSTVAGYRLGGLVAPAYEASAILAKTEDVSQEVPIEEDFWVAGLEWAEAEGADIISSSLAYIDWYVYEDLDGDTCVTTIAADLAAGRGLLVVNSAGNSRASLGHILAPADGDSVLTVGAVDAAGDYTFFSSPGPTADGRIKPDVMALGLGNPVANPTNDTAYVYVSGTSFSCPLVAGVAALMLSRLPDLTPMQVIEALRATADNAATPDNDFGWGVVDALAAVGYYGPVFDHVFLDDTEDVAGPYQVTTAITARMGLDAASAALRYRVNGGAWTSVALLPSGNPDEYSALIPGQPLGSTVEYYLEAEALDGFTARCPVYAPDDPAFFEVTTLVEVSLDAAPGLPCPEIEPVTYESQIHVPADHGGTVVSVGVDVGLTHPDAGEVKIALRSPQGTVVTLHDHTLAGTADLTGNWPLTLTVDGPGALSLFKGEPSTGLWTLIVSHTQAGAYCVLDTWGLDFTLKHFVSATGNGAPRVPAVLYPNIPNPFNPRTVLSFALESPGHARLSIFDLRGMLVRNLLDRSLPAGPHTVTWDGRDGSGRQAGSGAYFFRLEAGGGVLERKMLLVR